LKDKKYYKGGIEMITMKLRTIRKASDVSVDNGIIVSNFRMFIQPPNVGIIGK
jgi:hypothetical protein